MYRDPSSALPVQNLAAFLRAVAGAVAPVEVCFAPDISPKQIAGTLSWASVTPGEQPVALVDSTVLQSGRAGVLVTTAAVYVDSPRVRFALGEVRYEPALPRGRAESATLQTAQGGLMLPRMPTPETNLAMVRMLSALAQWVRGAWRLPLGAGGVPGPIGAIAAQCLRHPSLAIPPSIPSARLLAAAASLPRWIEPDGDEEVVAFVDETLSGDGTTASVLTDRRLLSNTASGLADVPYASLAAVEVVHGIVGSAVRLGSIHGIVDWKISAPKEAALAVGAFLHNVATLPPELRRAQPPNRPGADDPTGARTLQAWLPFPDPRVSLLLKAVHAGHAAGEIAPDAAMDLVMRARLLHRAIRAGHARHGEAWVSPLAAPDLDHVVRTLFGRPLREGQMGWGYAMEFELGARGSAAGTIASAAVGLALLAVVGVGWVTTGGTRTQRFTVRVGAAPSGSFFSFTGTSGAPLAADQPKLYAALAAALVDASAEVLLRRVIFGWNASPADLRAVPDATLEGAVAARIPGLDAGLFLRRG